MVEREIVQEWLAKANDDFEFARVNLEEGKNFFPQICFHFQQSAEKVLKAYIIAHDLEFRKIHDLFLLLKICIRSDPAFVELESDCELLAPFYIETRYPVHWPTHFSSNEANQAFESAQRINYFVKKKLTLSVRE
jgi:HEPN domain-containing protein